MNPEPAEIIIGDTITWIRRDVEAVSENDNGTLDYTDIKASEGWTLKFVAVGDRGFVSITATADTDDADDFKFTATAAATALYAAGNYQWQVTATKTTTRYTIAEGTVVLLDNIGGRSALYDNRSHAKKVLDAIEAVIEGRATKDQQQYQIAGRSLQLTPIPDLLRMRSIYLSEYNSELEADRIKAGFPSKRKILTRFV